MVWLSPIFVLTYSITLLPMPFIDQPREIEIQTPVVAIERVEHETHAPVRALQNETHGRIFDVETERQAGRDFLRILLRTGLIQAPSETNNWESYTARYDALKHTSGGREVYHLLQQGWKDQMITNSADSQEMVAIYFRVPGKGYQISMGNYDFSVAVRSSREIPGGMSSTEDEIDQKKMYLDVFHLKVQAELWQCFPSSLLAAFEDAKRSPIDLSSFNMALDRYGDMLRCSLSPEALDRLLSYEHILFGEDIFKLEPSVVLPDQLNYETSLEETERLDDSVDEPQKPDEIVLTPIDM